ncbi:hypothetical protein CLAIMM_12561 [Cladophialophora immunda]|nr:hypothetical protein CLAIMM_12561 [Cladophialophora immunda]
MHRVRLMDLMNTPNGSSFILFAGSLATGDSRAAMGAEVPQYPSSETAPNLRTNKRYRKFEKRYRKFDQMCGWNPCRPGTVSSGNDTGLQAWYRRCLFSSISGA